VSDELARLFENNAAWAQRMRSEDPQFFQRLAEQQSPQYLWIGCSDSRVPANQIIDLAPGEVFVHRNIANQVVHTDFNCLSVVQFAVDVLRVRHVIVCGHYRCGGVSAALENQRYGLVDNWLRHLHDVIAKHRDELERIAELDRRAARLCELNVIEQVANVARTDTLQRAWANGQPVSLHGWVYDVANGLLRDLHVTDDGH
jgi:carbonic anhydrase